MMRRQSIRLRFSPGACGEHRNKYTEMPNTLDGIVLLGWMEKAEAIAYLRERCWFDPQLTENEAEALWVRYYLAVERLPDRPIQTPERLPIPAFAKDCVGHFLSQHGGPELLDVININPLGLAIYQFHLAVGHAEQYAQHLEKEVWTRICLEVDRPVSQLPMRIDGNTIKISLPHGEHGLTLRTDGAFQIQQGAGCIRVCEIGGRMLLKAGYHRCFAYARSIMTVPDADICFPVALTATAPPQLSEQFPVQGLRTIVLGSRPAFFADFFDDSLAMKVKIRRKKYEFHFHLEQVDDLWS
jgi:hypothetical protein